MIIGPVALGGSTDERAGLPKLGEVDANAEFGGQPGPAHLGLAVWAAAGRQSGSSLYIRSEITDGHLNCLTTA